MPSRYEPCGLNQLYSLRYGTLPIARKTGGLADTIIDIDADPKNGTGFLFSEMKNRAIIDATSKAINMYYYENDRILEMKKISMNTDFTWDKSAEEYMRIYQRGI
jgi:starch synthase